MRINKYLAECGIASRRNCEQLITCGRVKVNGKVVTNLATDIGENDTVSLDDKKVTPIAKHIYIMLHKPKGVVTTTNDEKGRKTVLDLIGKYKDKRLFPVGRLDYDTEGLLLLTTDGDLSNRITHPRNEITKTYVAKVEGEMSPSEIKTLQEGVVLDGVKTKRCRVALLDYDGKISRVELKIGEGRNRQVRRMFEAIGREVIFLRRTAIGELKLGGLSRGEWRELQPYEVEYLQRV